ncbi:MAG: replication initiation factor domain-containing protein [Anaerolineae bacterium]|nr:replication initiation factor domain-containing protein [Anaerolineae bacterium]
MTGQESGVRTPLCNTGVHSPFYAQNDGVKSLVSLDWIAFTVPKETFEKSHGLAEFIESLQIPISEYSDTEAGRLGWKRCTEFDGLHGAFVATVGQDGTAYVQLSAQAIKFYAALGWDVWKWTRYMVNNLMAKCRRLDIAFDDHGGLLNYGDIVKAVEAKNVVSRYANKYDPERKGSLSGTVGWTLYFGSYGGETFVRIYDKAKEQKLTDGTHWIRVEAVFRADRAHLALVQWMKNEFSAACAVGLLRGLVDFRITDESKKVHPERLPFVCWWEEFLGEAKAVHLGTDAKDPRKVSDYHEFLRTQAAAALALINDVYGEEVISELIAYGRGIQGKRHKEAAKRSEETGDNIITEIQKREVQKELAALRF